MVYGVDKERKKSITVNNGVTRTKYYVGTLFEEEYINNEVLRINYIFANGGAVAIYEKSNVNGEKQRYLHKDHLGSIQAYSDETGKLVQELSYDAWGRRRNPANWAYYPALTDANAWHPRGFTGHEHLDLFEMINMNGRMYDPVLGRFLSPDPYIQAPDYTQGLNRYVYCLNNPLSLFDPSGYSWFSKNWKSLLSATVGIAVTIVSGGIASGIGGVMIAGALGGAAAGLSGALLNGANIGQIAKSTFTGGLWGAAAGFLANASGDGQFLERLFKHSFSQAWLEGIRGGNMKHGFMAGLASAAGGSAISKYGENIGKVGRISANAVLTGTVSEIGGGKFANGAITGAFSMMFNDIWHEVQENKKLRSYVEKMFPDRIPKGVKVKFTFHNENYRLTKTYIVPKPKYINVYIPKSYWDSKDNRLLIDCIDHELVHVNDYASGRAYQYYKAFSADQVNHILEYKAYSENQWYNENMRQPGDRYDYTDKIEYHRKGLPSGWWNIK